MRRTRRARDRAERAYDEAAGGAVSNVNDTVRWVRDRLGSARVGGLARLVRCDDQLVVEYSTDEARVMLTPVWHAARLIRCWEHDRIIYRLDATLVDELVGADGDIVLRRNMLRHVPHRNPCLVFTRPIDVSHPDGGTVRYTTVFVAGQRIGTDGRPESCDVHDPATTHIGFALSGAHERAGHETARTISTLIVDIADDESSIETMRADADAIAEPVGTSNARSGYLAPVLATLVPTIRYLCCEEPDVRPMAIPDGASWHDEPSSERSPDVLEIGWRVGAALRDRHR
jgi:hypothetical protein